ncbi:hypothetical protein Skr01_59600 [Sphaerisporangium krabiense]|nr:hypothetical protein Skr01_59600 [Sphaerisporangium krabiense]
MRGVAGPGIGGECHVRPRPAGEVEAGFPLGAGPPRPVRRVAFDAASHGDGSNDVSPAFPGHVPDARCIYGEGIDPLRSGVGCKTSTGRAAEPGRRRIAE